jgi:NTE family protein
LAAIYHFLWLDIYRFRKTIKFCGLSCIIKRFLKMYRILIGIIFFLQFKASSQTPIIRNLVLEGGGIKGIAYGGALLELDNKGVLLGITRCAGTSAGAIQAALLAIGYSPEEIIEIVTNTPVESFNDDGFVVKAAKRMTKEYGWFRGDSFLKKMESVIFERTGNANLTFAQLHDLAKTYPFRDLYVTGVNLSEQKLEVFSYETHPNMRIADAVRVSMSIPLYYRGIWLDKTGKVFENPSDGQECSLYVDGGLLANYPIEIFDNTRYLGDSVSNWVFNQETLGMRLENCEQIDHEITQREGLAPKKINDLNSYMDALSGIIMRNIKAPNPDDIKRTIFINDLGKSAKVRKVPEEEKKAMIAAGRQGVLEYFMGK